MEAILVELAKGVKWVIIISVGGIWIKYIIKWLYEYFVEEGKK